MLPKTVNPALPDPDDVDAFADGIKKIKADKELRKQLSINNRETVKAFCISETKKEVIKIIKAL